jgi:S-formylglutathione hydrolase FrmB
VIVGPDMAEPAPLNLVLHCWGSNFRGKGGAYSWFAWKDRRIGIGVASNEIPYDWWTCYHENRETWKPWTDGVPRDITANRLLGFVDFVASKWGVDRDCVCVSGESMGGVGSAFMGLRYPERFAYVFSAAGVHDPAAIKGSGFHESYTRVCGRMESQIKHESGVLTFDYLGDPLWVLALENRRNG